MEVSKNIYNVAITLWVILLLIIVYWNSKGKVHFGLGLADMLISALIIFCVVVVSAFTIYEIKNGKMNDIHIRQKWVLFFSLIFLIYILLKMTILRGGESPWDGQIFF